MSGKLFIVSAPSGAGKTTLVGAVLQTLQPRYHIERVVTYTSKTPRAIEVNGRDYHFISSQDFENKIQDGFFIEWSGEYGHYYGTPATILEQLNSGISLIVVIDRLGAKSLMAKVPNAISIWITVENLVVLEQRLLCRGTENADQIIKRLVLAKKEIIEEHENRFYHHHILNITFKDAQKSIENIIIRGLETRPSMRTAKKYEYAD